MKNNKNLLAIIAVVVVVVIGAGAYFMFMKKDDTTMTNSTDTKNSASNKSSATTKSTKGNIYSLSGSSAAQTCTYKFTSTEESGSGVSTMYNDGKGNAMMDIEVSSSQDGKGKMSTLIIGDIVYFWSEEGGKKSGFKYAKPADMNSTPNTSNTQASGVDMKQTYDLDCHDWKVDPAKFTVPKDVEFMDMTNMTGMN